MLLVVGCMQPSAMRASESSTETSATSLVASSSDATTSTQGATSTTTGTDVATGSSEASSDSNASSGSTTDACDVEIDTRSLCTSAQLWLDGDEASTLMRPGAACNACHDEIGGAPAFAVAGTVYPTLHEPTDCYGASGDIIVRILGSDDAELDLPVGSSGNFFAAVSAGIVFPIRAEVVFDGRMRGMCGWVPHGDCNLCHTEEGVDGAPGRVRLP